MGFFNAMSAIGNINSLLKDFENQVIITQDLVERNAPISNLNNSLNVLKSIHQELIDNFDRSSAARTAMFKIFGDKMQMMGILTYTRNVVYNLAAIISQRS
jgi:hypothetical protein